MKFILKLAAIIALAMVIIGAIMGKITLLQAIVILLIFWIGLPLLCLIILPFIFFWIVIWFAS